MCLGGRIFSYSRGNCSFFFQFSFRHILELYIFDLCNSISCSGMTHYLASALKIFLWKNFLYFLLKNLIWKSFLYFLKKAFLIFRKRNFLIFRERYIQNSGIFRTVSNICDGIFCKNSSLTHFSASALKKFPQIFLIFFQKKPPEFQKTELFLYFKKGIFRTLA